MQFLENKYTKIYFGIIQNAQIADRNKHRSTHKDYIYYENHHIVPRSLNGTDDSENLVLLTAREHFLCHYLLCKMVEQNDSDWHKIVRAFTFMYSSGNGHKRYFNSRLYESARRNIGKVMSVAQTGDKNSQFGTVWVSHIPSKSSIRISKDDLELFLLDGYVQKRIINWDQYAERQVAKKLKQQAKIKNKVACIETKIKNLELEKQELLLQL